MDWPSQTAEARKRIAAHIRRTPVVEADLGLTHPVAFKLEHLQHTGSFKARGAFNTLLSQPVPAAGLVAASGGNHGAAVAYAAAALGHKAQIYVPELAGPEKIALIERQGAMLTVVPGTYADALNCALDYSDKTDAMQIHAYDAPATVAGQGTCMAEWEEQDLEADTVLIAVGGGGLIAGALGWLNGRRRVVAVEPTTCAALHAALSEGHPVDIAPSGLAANALGAKRIGTICFDLAKAHDIDCVLVSDTEIVAAQRWLWDNLRLLVEPAGATALAALQSGAYKPHKDERIAILLCGGNVAPDPFAGRR